MFDDDILWFDVSMYDSIAVNVGDSFIYIAENEQYLWLCEFLPLFDKFV